MKPLLLFFLMATTSLSCQTPVTEVIFHPHEDTVVYQQEPNPLRRVLKQSVVFQGLLLNRQLPLWKTCSFHCNIEFPVKFQQVHGGGYKITGFQ